MTASLTMSVVRRNWSADRTSIRAIVSNGPEIPRPKSQTPNPNQAARLGPGTWVLGFGIYRYDRKDDSTADYRVMDDSAPHVQAEGHGELSVPEGADVPEVPRQAGADARRERSREVRCLRTVLGGVSGRRDLPRGGGK